MPFPTGSGRVQWIFPVCSSAEEERRLLGARQQVTKARAASSVCPERSWRQPSACTFSRRHRHHVGLLLRPQRSAQDSLGLRLAWALRALEFRTPSYVFPKVMATALSSS